MGNEYGDNGVKTAFQRQQETSKLRRLRLALYDPNTGAILGRTSKSWVKILVFYAIYYFVLAILFFTCMQGLLMTLDDRSPKWKMDNGLIGSNPGLGFQPRSVRTEEGSLIWYNTKNHTTILKWVDQIDKFMQPYMRDQTGGNFQYCDFDRPVRQNYVCTVDPSKFGPCSPRNKYGYVGSSPCVFLKLNKIFGWQPEYYLEPEPNMPQDMKDSIIRLPRQNRSQIWISCEGEGPVDKEHVKHFNYFPSHGFPGFYYPFDNSANYLSPLIAVQIVNPKPNVLISIECRAWAKNIQYQGGDLKREGSVHFEIIQDV